METKKYLDEQNRIASIAYSLFREKGFAETSYGDIAAACGIKKSLLQYYFPKKDDFISLFVERSFDIITHYDGLNLKNDIIGLEKIYLLAYFEYWYICNWEPSFKITKDLIASRAYGKVVEETITDWMSEYLHIKLPSFKKELLEIITVLVGGGFEYAYMSRQNKEIVDVDRYVDMAMSQLAGTVLKFGFAKEKIKKPKIVTDEWLIAVAKDIDQKIFNFD